MINNIFGSIVALVTPMRDDGEIDLESLKSLVELHIENGTNGIVVGGTTGEAATLSRLERIIVIREVVKQVNRRIPVIAGTGTNCTSSSIELTQSAKDAGADACLLITPYYNKPTQEGLFSHFKHIAESVCVPQILYTAPHRTCVDMKLSTIQKLSRIDNIIGINDASENILSTKTLIENTSEDFIVLSGNDAIAVEMISIGAKGCVSVAANIIPDIVANLYNLVLNDMHWNARKINEVISPIFDCLNIEENPIPIKWLMSEHNLIKSGIRLPLTPLTENYRQQILDTLHTIKCAYYESDVVVA